MQTSLWPKNLFMNSMFSNHPPPPPHAELLLVCLNQTMHPAVPPPYAELLLVCLNQTMLSEEQSVNKSPDRQRALVNISGSASLHGSDDQAIAQHRS